MESVVIDMTNFSAVCGWCLIYGIFGLFTYMFYDIMVKSDSFIRPGYEILSVILGWPFFAPLLLIAGIFYFFKNIFKGLKLVFTRIKDLFKK